MKLPPSPFPWLATLQGAAAVDVAARRGTFDRLQAEAMPTTGSDILDNVLLGVGVLLRANDGLQMSPAFGAAWKQSGADIVAVASFFRRAASDVATGFEHLAFDVPAFMTASSTFRLFRYDRAEGETPEHLDATRPWVDYVEALSRFEAPLLVPELPVDSGDTVLEIGGNTGVLAAALLQAHDELTVTILDLPAVCALGRARRDIPRLSFHAGDARQPDAMDDFTGKINTVLFKSVLHDWPEGDTREMLARAAAALPSGGKLIVCERQPYGAAEAAVGGMTSLGNLVFAPFYRAAGFYENWMADAGLDVTKREVIIDMPFHIVSGVKR